MRLHTLPTPRDEMPKKEKGAAAAPVSAQLPTQGAHACIQKNTHARAHTVGKVTISLIVINYQHTGKKNSRGKINNLLDCNIYILGVGARKVDDLETKRHNIIRYYGNEWFPTLT